MNAPEDVAPAQSTPSQPASARTARPSGGAPRSITDMHCHCACSWRRFGRRPPAQRSPPNTTGTTAAGLSTMKMARMRAPSTGTGDGSVRV
jgi:hypothetical protein